ncbi:MAG: hypothetical protein COA96_18395 [SAR86 cluster bacterium]|uniref:Uncharacterized protein n=1 Tax=SAR86 cluster bacterium TaxID=2030880 RepID=A0A2A5AB42_9GAMM|nr:MAG: hypothetical protein COA96_18395 [SAR86 cluster bacterium]
MSKKSKNQAEQGTYALCITVGLIIGIGLGPMMGSLLYGSLTGGAVGAGTGYFFSHLKKRRKKHSHSKK